MAFMLAWSTTYQRSQSRDMGTRSEVCAAASTPSFAASTETSTATVPLDNPGADA